MGGQISRYALAFMEKKKAQTGLADWDHNCRLWVSFDSPHEGANIAISVQQNLDFLANEIGNSDAQAALKNEVLSTASKQFLIEQMDGLNGTSPFHQKYYYGITNNGFDSLNKNGVAGSHGYPMQCRKVALVNGSRDGVLGINDGQMVSKIEGNVVVVQNLYNHRYAMPAYNSSLNTFKADFINDNSLFGFGIQFGAFQKYSYHNTKFNFPCPNQSSFTQNYTYNARLASFLFFHTFQSTFHFKKSYNVLNKNTHGSMDCVPGGSLYLKGDLEDKIVQKFLDKFPVTFAELKFYKPNFTFIPVISALGFKNSNFNWSKKISDRNLTCGVGGNETYFDNYYAPKENQDHVKITDESYAWVIKEIEKGRLGSDCDNTSNHSFTPLNVCSMPSL